MYKVIYNSTANRTQNYLFWDHIEDWDKGKRDFKTAWSIVILGVQSYIFNFVNFWFFSTFLFNFRHFKLSYCSKY